MQFFQHKYTVDIAEPLCESNVDMATRSLSHGDGARPSGLAWGECETKQSCAKSMQETIPFFNMGRKQGGEKRRMRQGRWRILKEFFFLDRLIHCHLTKHYKNWTTISHPAPCTQPNLDFTLILQTMFQAKKTIFQEHFFQEK